jgi:alanyl-tRNA synthetase
MGGEFNFQPCEARMESLIPGSEIFRMKDEKGLPLPMLIDMCLTSGKTIEWPSFVEAARSSGWYDFQTHSQIKAALAEADVGEDYATNVIQRFKLYVLANPHTCLLSE